MCARILDALDAYQNDNVLLNFTGSRRWRKRRANIIAYLVKQENTSFCGILRKQLKCGDNSTTLTVLYIYYIIHRIVARKFALYHKISRVHWDVGRGTGKWELGSWLKPDLQVNSVCYRCWNVVRVCVIAVLFPNNKIAIKRRVLSF